MNAAVGYCIADEPHSAGISHLAVNPLWPFFGYIFGGVWLAWPWFVVNAFVVGSPTRKKELGLAIGGFLGLTALFFFLAHLIGLEILPRASAAYVRLILLLWKIGVTYGLYTLQSQTFEIYEYYGGRVRSGLILVVVAYFLWNNVGRALRAASPILYVLLS